MQRSSQLLSFYLVSSVIFKITYTCYLPQVSLSEHHMLETKLLTHNFEKVPIILSSLLLEFYVKLPIYWIFYIGIILAFLFSVFCIAPNTQRK